MFSSILKRYNDLIDNDGRRDSRFVLLDAVRYICETRRKRSALQKELNAQNEQLINDLAKQRVKEYVSSSRDDKDFFDQIAHIRLQTQTEINKRFENDCEQWADILDNAEGQLLLMLKERLNLESIRIGTTKMDDGAEKRIEWIVTDADPFHNCAQLLMRESLQATVFHNKGYTVVEDEDTFGCAELACSWCGSDIRNYLNGDFYNNAFSDKEKSYILKTDRYSNKSDHLIPNDHSEDLVYLPNLEEFLRLDPKLRPCEHMKQGDAWWLCEQNVRGWHDTGELPKIYAVNCDTGELTSFAANEKMLPRVSMTVKLDALISSFADILLW